MNLEIGKFYKTRSGKKAYVFYAFKSKLMAQKYLVAIANRYPYEVYKKGNVHYLMDSDDDLLREWIQTSRHRIKTREVILKMLKQGKSYSEIREKTGVAHSTIARAKKFGHYKTAHYDKPKKVEMYKKLIKEDLTLKEIAKRMHKSVKAVSYYIYANEELRALKMQHKQVKGKRK